MHGRSLEPFTSNQNDNSNNKYATETLTPSQITLVSINTDRTTPQKVTKQTKKPFGEKKGRKQRQRE